MLEAVRAVLVGVAQALVDHENCVQVEVLVEEDLVIFILEVDSRDVGKVIGKQGRTARSLRTILNGMSMKTKYRFQLDIRE